MRSYNTLIAALLFAAIPAMLSAREDGTSPATALAQERAREIRLPSNDHHYKRTSEYVETVPEDTYLHAPEAAYEAFRDIKFAVRIHWGIYSIREMNGESWGFLKLSNAKKQHYNELYKTFNPTGFDAGEWMSLFSRAGIRCMAFTTKHHEGFSMFHTKTRVKQRVNYAAPREQIIEPCDLAYSIEETPFKRDIVKELCEAARQHNIKIDLYFSHPDWYDADFRPYNHHPLATPSIRKHPNDYGRGYKPKSATILTPERTPEETTRMLARHREQLRELLTNYGKIDLLCLDQWMGKDIWPQMRETVKMIRQLQPDIMIRCRGIGNYGDYYTPEGFVPGRKENTLMPWMVIYPLGSSFSYDKNGSKYKGASWIIRNLADSVAKGGSFMVGIGPDKNGKFHPNAIKQLEQVGAWLKINGEGIYETRPREIWKEGDNIRYTRSRDKKHVYAIHLGTLTQDTLTLTSVLPKPGSKVTLFGHPETIDWTRTDTGIHIPLPPTLPNPGKLAKHVYVFRFDVDE